MAESASPSDGFAATIAELKDEIQALYRDDEIPWVVGYSGGKDSTAILQLVWLALAEPARGRAQKARPRDLDRHPGREPGRGGLGQPLARGAWRESAERQGLPITPHRLTPKVEDTLLGEPDRSGLPGAATEVPLVHRAAQDQALERLHPGRRQVDTARRSWCSASARPSRRLAHAAMETRGTRSGARPPLAERAACRTRWSTPRSRTGPTTTSGSS